MHRGSVRELQCKADVGNETIVEKNHSEQMELIKLYLYNYCALYIRWNNFLIDQMIIANGIQRTSNITTTKTNNGWI